MAVYAITGKLGSGKTLCSVGRIVDYLRQGRPVATNLDLHLDKLFSARSKINYTRIPDIPTIRDFEMLGKAHDGYDESRNGLLVLDECGVFFNSRDWADKGRQAIISWLLHSRKLGWDVILIVQDIQLIDKQIRTSLLEHVGICKRTDRMSIPFIGGLLRYFGLPSRPPRMHVCTVKYGTDIHALVVDRWYYRGSQIQDGYDTKQVFRSSPDDAPRSMLSPWHTRGRYLPPTGFQALKLWLEGQNLRPRIPLKPKLPEVAALQHLPKSLRIPALHELDHWQGNLCA